MLSLMFSEKCVRPGAGGHGRSADDGGRKQGPHGPPPKGRCLPLPPLPPPPFSLIGKISAAGVRLHLSPPPPTPPPRPPDPPTQPTKIADSGEIPV